MNKNSIPGCTYFFLHWKSEHLVSQNPPIHPNPNIVPICKSVHNIGRSLSRPPKRGLLRKLEYIIKKIDFFLHNFFIRCLKVNKEILYWNDKNFLNKPQSILRLANGPQEGFSLYPVCAIWEGEFQKTSPYRRVHFWHFALQKGPFLAPKMPYNRVHFCQELRFHS